MIVKRNLGRTKPTWPHPYKGVPCLYLALSKYHFLTVKPPHVTSLPWQLRNNQYFCTCRSYYSNECRQIVKPLNSCMSIILFFVSMLLFTFAQQYICAQCNITSKTNHEKLI